MDRFVVLFDGEVWRLVTDLSALFGKQWVGVQVRELKERTGGPPPEVRLETVISRDVPMECLSATEEIRSTVLCGERGGSFRCMRIDTQRKVEATITGTAHGMSSQYDYQTAERCRPILDKHGLTSEPGKDRKILEQTATPLTFPPKRPLADMLDEGNCHQTEF